MPAGEPVLAATDRVLVCTPAANSHRKDFDFVFKPESVALQRIYGANVCTIVRVLVAGVDRVTLKVLSNQAAFEAGAAAVLTALRSGPQWTHLIMMCHGWETGVQLGFRSQKQRGDDAAKWQTLIAAIQALPLKTITLFACSAGADPRSPKKSPGTGNDSFADELRDATGVPVIAHTTVGHATRNPNLIVFERSTAPLIGGLTIATRPSALFRNAVQLLSPQKNKRGKVPGSIPPAGHSRVAFASIPLCQSASELQALLSARPG